MGRNITTRIPRIISPRGVNENGMWKKFKGERREFTELDRDTSIFLRRKKRVIHYGIQKRKIVELRNGKIKERKNFYLKGLLALVPEKLIAAGIKRLLG